LDNINDEHNIELLADLVLAKILEKYGDISPLTLLANEEELLISELARLNTILVMLEEKEEYRKAAIVLKKINRIEKRLNDDN
jgi:uncharacterized protein YqgQ|tara:strand:+ start:197 stop:445 length:249 start_codon:yes stop_codon:yes gene_type:complete